MVKKVSIEDESLRYATSGEGRLGLLFFPGSGQVIETSKQVQEHFSQKYKTIIFEYEKVSSVDLFFRYVDEVIKREKISELIVYGLSVGGFLARIFATRNSNVRAIILSHTSTIHASTFRRRVVIPGKMTGFFLPIIPEIVLKKALRNYGGVVQGVSDKKVGTTSPLFRKSYLRSFFSLCMDIAREERALQKTISENCKILLLRTDNDPLGCDDGLLKKWYPWSEEYTFHGSGHITDFINFSGVAEVIDSFLERSVN